VHVFLVLIIFLFGGYLVLHADTTAQWLDNPVESPLGDAVPCHT